MLQQRIGSASQSTDLPRFPHLVDPKLTQVFYPEFERNYFFSMLKPHYDIEFSKVLRGMMGVLKQRGPLSEHTLTCPKQQKTQRNTIALELALEHSRTQT